MDRRLLTLVKMVLSKHTVGQGLKSTAKASCKYFVDQEIVEVLCKKCCKFNRVLGERSLVLSSYKKQVFQIFYVVFRCFCSYIFCSHYRPDPQQTRPQLTDPRYWPPTPCPPALQGASICTLHLSHLAVIYWADWETSLYHHWVQTEGPEVPPAGALRCAWRCLR